MFFLNANQFSDEAASVVHKLGAVRLHKDGPARDDAGAGADGWHGLWQKRDEVSDQGARGFCS